MSVTEEQLDDYFGNPEKYEANIGKTAEVVAEGPFKGYTGEIIRYLPPLYTIQGEELGHIGMSVQPDCVKIIE
jgi:hypothetical protein